MVREVRVGYVMNKSPIIKFHLAELQSSLLGGKECLRERRREYNRRYAERHPERVARSREKQKSAKREYAHRYNRERREDIKERKDINAQKLHFDGYAMKQRYDDHCRMIGRVVDVNSKEYVDGIEDWKENIDNGGRGNSEWYMSHFSSPKERDAYCQHCRRRGLPYKINEEGCLDELDHWKSISRKYGNKNMEEK